MMCIEKLKNNNVEKIEDFCYIKCCVFGAKIQIIHFDTFFVEFNQKIFEFSDFKYLGTKYFCSLLASLVTRVRYLQNETTLNNLCPLWNLR